MTTISWSQIEAECGDYRAGFVETFRKYEGRDTDEIGANGQIIRVSVSSFARHLGIAKTTFQNWIKVVDQEAQPTRSPSRGAAGAARRFAATLPATERAKLAAELLEDDEVEVAPAVIARQASRPDVARAIARNDEAREAVEDQGIEVRAMRRPELPTDIATPEARRESAERFRQDAGRAFGHETDEATNYLNGAANDLGHAIFAKEHWGIRFPEAEAEALEKIDRYLAAYRAGTTNKLSDDDRGWLEAIGVEL